MEEQLIELVKQNSFLYDKRRKSYKNIDAKQKKWKEIATELNIPVDKVKQRWVTLRDRYNREKKSVFKASGSGASYPKKPWNYLDYMRFLDDIPTTNILTSGNYVVDENANCSKTSANFSPQHHSTPTVEKGIKIPDSEQWHEFDDPEFSFLPPPPPPCLQHPELPQSSRRQRQPNLTEELQKAQKEMSEMLQLAKASFQTSSSIQLFFASMATSIDEAKLSSEAISRIKANVFSIVEAEIANNDMQM